MRRLALGLLSGCFAPSPPAGAPCDPASATPCPADQVCTTQAGGAVCLAPGTPDAPVVPPDAPGVPPDAASDAPTALRFTYPADIAECVDPAAPDPAACRMQNSGTNADLFQLVVDLQDTPTNHPWVGYVRFPVDTQLAGRTLTAVTLRLTDTDDVGAPSNSTGEVFPVAPFTLAELTGTAPAKAGARLAPSQGAVELLDVVDVPLPLDSVRAGELAYFGIFPVSTMGVNYWNSSGPNPPVLLIDTE